MGPSLITSYFEILRFCALLSCIHCNLLRSITPQRALNFLKRNAVKKSGRSTARQGCSSVTRNRTKNIKIFINYLIYTIYGRF